jgi:hypothetical protein
VSGAGIASDRIEQMRAHVDEGGKLSHGTAIELLNEVERLREETVAVSWPNKPSRAGKLYTLADLEAALDKLESTQRTVARLVEQRDLWYGRALQRAGIEDKLTAAVEERDELQRIFDLQQTRMREATALWRAEDPEGRALVLPDLGDLLEWLMKRGEVDRQALVDRFLMWPLPESVCSDLCATNPNYPFPRSGTNLLTADEARQMFEYLFPPRGATP